MPGSMLAGNLFYTSWDDRKSLKNGYFKVFLVHIINACQKLTEESECIFLRKCQNKLELSQALTTLEDPQSAPWCE